MPDAATHVVLVEYDADWPLAYAREAERIRPAFGELLIALHHIGSTSVPGLRAKPVIDMLAVVTSVKLLDTHTVQFESHGYEAKGEFGLPGRRYFRRDDSHGVRTHQIHAYAAESSGEIERHLNFRDYIRTHAQAAQAYAELKLQLAVQCEGDMARYSDGKTDFVREIEQRARSLKGE